MRINALRGLLMLPAALLLTSCLGDEVEKDYKDWRERNEEYIKKEEARTENGTRYYDKIVPVWAPEQYILMHWHNDRSLTEKNLSPLDNSTVNYKYSLENIDGEELQNSYSLTANGDSIFQQKPSDAIVGMWTALTTMHVGDSVTLVVPYTAGYGNYSSGKVLPYSTLIFHVKLVDIPAYEIPE